MASTQDPACAPTPGVSSPNLFSLVNKVALVTGGTRGIGSAVAVSLAQAGSAVCLVQRDQANTQTRDTIRGLGGRCEIVEADLSEPQATRSVFTRALELMGGEIHIMINCAGIQRRAPATEFSEQDWNDVIQTNLTAAWILSQEAGKHMVPLRRGKIINVASLLTFQGGITVPAYAAAKGGIGQLTKALSNEWARHNVQVNSIAPGYIATDMNERLLADPVRLRQISERIPANRWGTPSDFAGPAVFLASDASQYVSGEILVVDGGWMGR